MTLEDVAYLLGLAIDGEPVMGVTYTTCDTVCEKLLGKAPDSGYTSGGMVKLSWLKESFSHCPEDAPMEEIECHTRAYLLYLVGSTIFSTTTGNKVPVMYLPLFENFDQAGKYAWGAAALSFLYRALGNASLKSQSTVSGCLTLLQVAFFAFFFPFLSLLFHVVCAFGCRRRKEIIRRGNSFFLYLFIFLFLEGGGVGFGWGEKGNGSYISQC